MEERDKYYIQNPKEMPIMDEDLKKIIEILSQYKEYEWCRLKDFIDWKYKKKAMLVKFDD